MTFSDFVFERAEVSRDLIAGKNNMTSCNAVDNTENLEKVKAKKPDQTRGHELARCW